MKFLAICLIFIFTFPLQAQEFETIDSIYLPEVSSVTLHPQNVVTAYPIVDLNRNRLKLAFDDLTGVFAEYTYSFHHCNRNWELSREIQDFDFRRGFVEEEIFNFSMSNGTDVPYTHFELELPNNNMGWLISGNYILVVYKIEGEKKIAFTRRFSVVDPKINISAELQRPIDQSLARSHHEIDFYAEFEDFTIRNPYKEVNAQIYQNGIWKLGYSNINPQTVTLNTLSFNYQNQIVFPALKEFRHFDIRNIEFRTERVFEIYKEKDTINVILDTDRPRKNTYFTYFDINGKFVLQNMDGIRSRIEYDGENEQMRKILEKDESIMNRRIELMSEYVNVHFSLNMEKLKTEDVYIIGAFNNWKMDDESKMSYDEKDGVYFNKLLLKQGYYEYIYVSKERRSGEINWTTIEGSRYETINEYLIYIFYRPFGTLYDQLIGMKTFESTAYNQR